MPKAFLSSGGKLQWLDLVFFAFLGVGSDASRAGLEQMFDFAVLIILVHVVPFPLSVKAGSG